ncbi:MAG TPA: DUF2905 domain-containing protein [Candidatus Manganitrophaceae bacterium]|nr:DUF2905 domain-containing protein [Candidatus Manganitrophaceae bacterium]
MFEIGRTLIFLGLVIVAVGAVVLLLGKVPGIGKLPGDILIQRKNFTFYFPIATSILLSILLSLVFWLLSKR